MYTYDSFTNSWGKKRNKKQGRKGKVYQLNAEFQRIARRDKKAFFNEQCKETEENNKRVRLEIPSRKLEISKEHVIQRRPQ